MARKQFRRLGFFLIYLFSTMSKRLEFSHGLRKAHEPQALDSYCLRSVFNITMETRVISRKIFRILAVRKLARVKKLEEPVFARPDVY